MRLHPRARALARSFAVISESVHYLAVHYLADKCFIVVPLSPRRCRVSARAFSADRFGTIAVRRFI